MVIAVTLLSYAGDLAPAERDKIHAEKIPDKAHEESLSRGITGDDGNHNTIDTLQYESMGVRHDWI